MIEFSRCGFFEGRVTDQGPTLTRCDHQASFTGANAEGVVAVACDWHYHLLRHPTPIPGVVAGDEETLARVAENQAAMDALLDSVGGT